MKKYFKCLTKMQLISFSILFLTAFLFNYWTPYAADDYSYMYNLGNGERITSVFQIFPSLAIHYMQYGNGRVVSHFFVMLFLMAPKIIFDVLNAFLFVFFIAFVLRITAGKKTFSVLLFFAVPTLFWLYMPAYGQVFLWLTGCINYMWSYLFALLFLNIYISLLRGKSLLDKKWKLILFCLFTFLFGNYSENVSFSVIFTGFLLMCVTMYQHKTIRKYLSYVFPIICGAAGYLVLLLSPSGSAKFSDNLTLSVLAKNGIDLFTTYYNMCKYPLILFFILLCIAVYHKMDKNEILIAIAYLFISFVAAAMLIIASYLPERSIANSVVFLLIGIVQLLQILRRNSHLEWLTLCVCVYLLISSVMAYWDGSYDIYRVHREQTARNERIENSIVSGELTIGVPIITSTTKYSCKYGLLDLNPQNSNEPFPNVYVAKYYGLNKIYVTYPDTSDK